MKEIILITGGCRSGKSGYALELGRQIPGEQKIFIATCGPTDEEMKQRVADHRKQRSKIWKTVEEPVLLSESITENSGKADTILVDCLTLWISNLLFEEKDDDDIFDCLRNLIQSLEQSESTIILVSNEVGTGIVPENRLARRFRDLVGFANQKIAACSDKVIWMVAGIPVPIKKQRILKELKTGCGNGAFLSDKFFPNNSSQN